jgi:hypothetical protein
MFLCFYVFYVFMFLCFLCFYVFMFLCFYVKCKMDYSYWMNSFLSKQFHSRSIISGLEEKGSVTLELDLR